MCFIVNCGDGTLSLYRFLNGCIAKRIIGENLRERFNVIAESCVGYFFVTLRNNIPVIFYRLKSGETVMLSNGERRVIQQGGNTEPYINAILGKKNMRLIYTVNGSIVTNTAGEAGSGAVRLDSVFGTPPYRLIPVVEGGYALLYTINNDGRHLGYREVTELEIGAFKAIYSPPFDVGDSSLCTHMDVMHLAFVSISRFAVRVMYMRYGDRVKNLWEGSRVGKVCVAAVGSDVYVWWESGGYIYQSVSRNGGESFNQYTREQKCGNVIKAAYLSPSKFNISEVLLNSSDEIIAPDEVKADMRQRFAAKQPKSAILNNLKSELDRKQQQIERLTYALQAKNEELSKTEYTLRKRCRELKAQLEQTDKVDN